MPERAAPILIADDQRDVRDALRLLLKSQGYEAHLVDTPAAALSAVKMRRFGAAFIDLNYSRDTTSGAEGLTLLDELRRSDAELPIVVMTAWGSIELAVEAMRRGASDFIEKPWDNTRLMSVLRSQVTLGEATRRAGRLGSENRLLRELDGAPLVAESDAMRAVISLADKVAPTEAAVLLLGENGTGKGVLARHIHGLSRRRDASLVQVNMGAIAESVFESEMFGHVRGAFTDAKADRMGRIELADGGTLFLDEVANLPHAQQAKVLRVLEEGEFERVGSSRTLRSDLRVISATNADLAREVDCGRFRKDLYFRINTVVIQVPALRHRRADTVPLAMHFLAGFAARFGRAGAQFSTPALRALESHPWPGNVRELMHVVERAVLLSSHDTIVPEDLGLEAGLPEPKECLEARTLAEAECAMIRDTLIRFDGNILKSAAALGLSRAALYRRMQKFGLPGNP
jgi:DNA-binding NtrC family response regulator